MYQVIELALHRLRAAPEAIQTQKRSIHRSFLIRYPDFERDVLKDSHIEDLCRLYDLVFFDQRINKALGDRSIHYEASRRLSRSGGKTTARFKPKTTQFDWFKISIAAALIENSFSTPRSEAKVCGQLCHNKLEALSQIVEHELVHLIEFLLWQRSSCKALRFQHLATGLFSHQEHVHSLFTPLDKARSLGIKPGSKVRFVFNGKNLSGVVARYRTRATVLVIDKDGLRYNDGRYYRKYYVPLEALEITV